MEWGFTELTELSCGKWVHLAHSPDPVKKRNFCPKNSVYLPPKNNFSNENICHASLKEAII